MIANASGDRIEINLVVLKRQPVILHDEIRSDGTGRVFLEPAEPRVSDHAPEARWLSSAAG